MKYQDFKWDFIGENTKEYTHGFHTYPAMMIPQIVRNLLEEFSNNNTKLLFDPYVGSGTSLVEAKLRGINAIGTDLNPLARLISRTKTNTVSIDKLKQEIEKFKKLFLQSEEYRNIDPLIPNFSIIDTWFKQKNKKDLGYIKGFIFSINDNSIKDFFLVAFSETIRKVSMTRQGEFKLYRIPEEKRESFNPNTFQVMSEKLENNLKGYLETNFSCNNNFIEIHDFNTSYTIPKNILAENSVDIIITSPPYGDSHTTVAYGQFSRLSNEWLDYKEAVKLDKILMGGKKAHTFHLFDYSPLDNILQNIEKIDKKRVLEVIDFYDDYLKSISNISKVVKNKGIVAYVVGNRRVCDIELPTDEITKFFFEKNGFIHLKTIIRNIPNKRLPSKTVPSNQKFGKKVSTMMKEYIVILQKK